jgi:hypothetical protein
MRPDGFPPGLKPDLAPGSPAWRSRLERLDPHDVLEDAFQATVNGELVDLLRDLLKSLELLEALDYVLNYYKKLVAFYKLAAQRGEAVVFAIT